MIEHEDIYEDDFEDFEDEEDEAYFDEVEDLRDKIEDLTETLSDQEEEAEINRQIAALQQAAGVALSADEVQALGSAIDQGYHPVEAFRALGLERDGDFDADFQATVEAVEEEQGRKLLASETDAMWERAQKAVADPTSDTRDAVWTEAKKAALDKHDPKQRKQYITGRFDELAKEDAPAPETVAPLSEDATSKERSAFSPPGSMAPKSRPTNTKETSK